ncbi:unnamed protein product [Rhodiola kirilowii]
MSSYPPLFRQPIDPSPDSIPIEEAPGEIDHIPVVDLHRLDSESLHDACKNWGLFRVVNHGVPLHLTTQLQDQARHLFSLSFESKQGLKKNPVTYFWGTPALTPSGSALKGSDQSVNWVEGFNFPISQLSDIDTDNPTLNAFRALLEEYGSHLEKLASALYESMAVKIGLDPIQFKTYLDESTGLIRVYRYPPSNSDQVLGMEEHTDSSVLSILYQDDQVSGLEVWKGERWAKVKPVFGSLVVNLGDMMQAMSNDVYKSVKHRVKLNIWKERISIGYFVFPVGDGVIRSRNYKPFCYNEFRSQVQIDIKSLGCKVGLERFRLTDKHV